MFIHIDNSESYVVSQSAVKETEKICFSFLKLYKNWVLTPTFEPKTRAMVTEVLSCVLTKPSKYLTSGPALGNKNKLQQTNVQFSYHNKFGEYYSFM